MIELHNVMTEFTRIYRRENPPLADAMLLYDRWLPGMLRRCAEVMKNCGPAGCFRHRPRSSASTKVSRRTFDRWRALGTGPRCKRLAGKGGVRIRRSWLEDWLDTTDEDIA